MPPLTFERRRYKRKYPWGGAKTAGAQPRGAEPPRRRRRGTGDNGDGPSPPPAPRTPSEADSSVYHDALSDQEEDRYNGSTFIDGNEYHYLWVAPPVWQGVSAGTQTGGDGGDFAAANDLPLPSYLTPTYARAMEVEATRYRDELTRLGRRLAETTRQPDTMDSGFQTEPRDKGPLVADREEERRIREQAESGPSGPTTRDFSQNVRAFVPRDPRWIAAEQRVAELEAAGPSTRDFGAQHLFVPLPDVATQDTQTELDLEGMNRIENHLENHLARTPTPRPERDPSVPPRPQARDLWFNRPTATNETQTDPLPATPVPRPAPAPVPRSHVQQQINDIEQRERAHRVPGGTRHGSVTPLLQPPAPMPRPVAMEPPVDLTGPREPYRTPYQEEQERRRRTGYVDPPGLRDPPPRQWQGQAAPPPLVAQPRRGTRHREPSRSHRSGAGPDFLTGQRYEDATR